MAGLGDTTWNRFRAGGLAACAHGRAGLRAFWAHKTKNIGGIGLVAGYAEHWLEQHDRLPLWLLHERGVLLMAFGAIVGVIGFYNTLAQWFGWP